MNSDKIDEKILIENILQTIAFEQSNHILTVSDRYPHWFVLRGVYKPYPQRLESITRWYEFLTDFLKIHNLHTAYYGIPRQQEEVMLAFFRDEDAAVLFKLCCPSEFF